MFTPILIPDLGEIVEDVRVVRWLKGVGESVSRDAELVEITTDKMDVIVESPVSGILREVHASAGDRAKVGDAIGAIEPTA